MNSNNFAPYPITFHPILKERIWGGRKLKDLYHKDLPSSAPIGESWEITDRPEGVSIISNGPLAGKSLRWLMQNHSETILGDVPLANGGRFPLLLKILDAREKLSLQVHPPSHLAAEMNGEPKTEMWYVAQAEPNADIFVGLKQGVTREEFARRIGDGTVAECFHRIPVAQGDAMFLNSGRVHALGAGLLIFEIQQNSDTTYRVFDWNRVGLDGKPRDLHVAQSLKCIDFQDFEPGLVHSLWTVASGFRSRVLADNPLFKVTLYENPTTDSETRIPVHSQGRMQIIACTTGRVQVLDPSQPVALSPGCFCLLPSALPELAVQVSGGTGFLLAEAAC